MWGTRLCRGDQGPHGGGVQTAWRVRSGVGPRWGFRCRQRTREAERPRGRLLTGPEAQLFQPQEDRTRRPSNVGQTHFLGQVSFQEVVNSISHPRCRADLTTRRHSDTTCGLRSLPLGPGGSRRWGDHAAPLPCSSLLEGEVDSPGLWLWEPLHSCTGPRTGIKA